MNKKTGTILFIAIVIILVVGVYFITDTNEETSTINSEVFIVNDSEKSSNQSKDIAKTSMYISRDGKLVFLDKGEEKIISQEPYDYLFFISEDKNIWVGQKMNERICKKATTTQLSKIFI